LFENRYSPNYLRLDRRIETGKLTTIHACTLHACNNNTNPADYVLFGSSTTNKIERWWRELHERLEKYFKNQLTHILESQYYDPSNDLHRKLLFYIYKPIISRECEAFVRYWNCHRKRAQPGTYLPTGVPNHMFSFPEKYGA